MHEETALLAHFTDGEDLRHKELFVCEPMAINDGAGFGLGSLNPELTFLATIVSWLFMSQDQALCPSLVLKEQYLYHRQSVKCCGVSPIGQDGGRGRFLHPGVLRARKVNGWGLGVPKAGENWTEG